jgi:hypothetical protein
VIRCKKLRDSAEGEACTMESPMCNGNPATTCWCHSNHMEHGKGHGLKAHDVMGFYGCTGCHEWYDFASRRQKVPRETREWYFYRANARSIVRAIELGIIKLV